MQRSSLLRRIQALTRNMSSAASSKPDASASNTQTKKKLNVHSFPRPPTCEKTDRALLVKWNDEIIAETKPGEAYWVLETTHPPTYYLPPSSFNKSAVSFSTISGYRTLCEWKGQASYHNLTLDSTNETVKGKIWSYESPTSRFRGIKDYLCIYASGVPWECFVDGEKVQPQEGKPSCILG